MSDKWAYSYNEQDYHGTFDSPEEATSEALDGYEEAWIGRCVYPESPEDYVDADLVLEHICCQDEFSTEYAEDWPDATSDQRDELTGSLRTVIRDWIKKHDLKPLFFTVEDVRRVSVDD